MRIAFILSPSCLSSNVYSGVVVQAQQWAKGLRELGHTVDFPRAHHPISWDNYDVVHLFQHGAWAMDVATSLRAKVRKLILSPIIDPPVPYGRSAALISQVPFERIRVVQRQRLLRLLGGFCDAILARSEHEAKSLLAVGIPAHKAPIAKIPISKDWNLNDNQVQSAPRNGAIFHLSHISQPRKNVRSLVAIALRHGMPLRLAGSISDPEFRSWLDAIIAEHNTITYLGRISDDEMLEEMLSCSAFCLPSLFEGVGLVALDAALCGANLVVTDRGGTPEYFGKTTQIINPLNVSAMTTALQEALRRPVPDMAARQHAQDHFSLLASARVLAEIYDGL